MGHPHAAPAATRDGFNYDRVADALGHRLGLLLGIDHAIRTGRGRHVGFLGQGAADRLVLQRIHGARIRSDEADVAALAYVCEMGILRQETVAGVDGVNVGDLGCADNPIDPQIALAGGRFADADGFVRHLNVHRVGVRFGIDRDRADVKFLARADDAYGDFPAIRNQNLLKHA